MLGVEQMRSDLLVYGTLFQSNKNVGTSRCAVFVDFKRDRSSDPVFGAGDGANRKRVRLVSRYTDSRVELKPSPYCVVRGQSKSVSSGQAHRCSAILFFYHRLHDLVEDSVLVGEKSAAPGSQREHGCAETSPLRWGFWSICTFTNFLGR